MSSAALLLPISTGAESHLQMGAPGAALKATAHVDFKIIIPPVLYLDVSDHGIRVPGAQPVAVMSNSRNLTLNATVRTSDSDVHARGLVLGVSAGKTIAQDALCMLGDAAHAAVTPVIPISPAVPAIPVTTRPAKAGDRQVICTVSMP